MESVEGSVITEEKSRNLNRGPGESVPFLVIQPSKGWVNLRLKELWEYR